MTAVLGAVLPIVPEVVTLPVLPGSQEADSECGPVQVFVRRLGLNSDVKAAQAEVQIRGESRLQPKKVLLLRSHLAPRPQQHLQHSRSGLAANGRG